MIDLKEYILTNMDDAGMYLGKEIHFECPDCGDKKGHCSFNIKKELFNCYKCGWSANPVTFIMKAESISYKEAESFLNTDKEKIPSLPKLKERLNKTFEEPLDKYTEEEHKNSKLPVEYISFGSLMNLKFNMKKTVSAEEAKKLDSPMDYNNAIFYMHDREFKSETLKEFKIGFCIKGHYKDRIIFPIQCGNKFSFQSRRMYDHQDQKYKNPPGAKYTQLLYNYQYLQYIKHKEGSIKRLFIVEGGFDCMRMFELGFKTTTAALGKGIHDHRISLLLDVNPEVVYLMLDSDAESQAYKNAYNLVNFFTTKIIHLPKGIDPDMIRERKQMLLHINNAKEYSKKELQKIKENKWQKLAA